MLLVILIPVVAILTLRSQLKEILTEPLDQENQHIPLLYRSSNHLSLIVNNNYAVDVASD